MPLACLIIPGEGGQRRVMLDRETLTVGRLSNQDLRLAEPCVSRQHAVICRIGDGYSVVDQGSSHGTFLNGEQIAEAVLNPGDVLQFGSLTSPKILFQIENAASAASADPSAADTETRLLSSVDNFPEFDQRQPKAARDMGQLTWLLSAARQLNAGGAIDEILTTLVRLTLQLTGVERGLVFLSQAGKMKLARGLDSHGEQVNEDSTISHRAIERAIVSDAKFSISDTLADQSAAGWASVIANNIRSIYCIPLRKRDARGQSSELLGLLYLDSQLGAGSLNEVDHQLLDTISTEAAALLHNALLAEAEYKARRAREELALAAQIHSGLMSIAMPVVPFAELHARTVPCHEIGGDFFDALELEDCVSLVIADVSGKGLPAAIVAATIQGIVHAQLLSKQSLPSIAAQVNEFLCTRKVGRYATMVVVKLYPDGRMQYMNCGHVKPLVVRAQGVTQLEESDLIVGLIPNVTYTSAEIQLNPGDRLLLVTDGLVEAENSSGESFGDSRLAHAVHEQNIDGILEQVARFHAPQDAQDDCTVVELAFRGASTPAPQSNSLSFAASARARTGRG